MRLFKHCLFSAVIGAIVLLLASSTQAAEFTAKWVAKANGEENSGKMYLKNGKERNEFPGGVIIRRPDKKVIWLLSPQSKSYSEMSTDSPKSDVQIMPYTAEHIKDQMKKIGTETVNGYECDKFEFKSPSGKAQHFWISQDLGVPLKMMSADGSFSSELTDIKQENLDDSLFELPPGYTKMQLPQVPPKK
jgi:outer membrane lipoprotein-sorting protein